MSSSRRSGSVSSNSRRHSGLVRETRCAGGPGLPDAQQPDPVEAHRGQAVQLGVRDVVQRGGPAERARQLGQPDAGVDLVQRRDRGPWHVGPPLHVAAIRTTADVHSPRRRLREGRYLAGLEQLLRIEQAEELDQLGHQPGPAGLVAGAEAGAVVAVEVLVEQEVVAPVRVVLELLACRRTPAAARSPSRRKIRVSRSAISLATSKGSSSARAGRALDLETRRRSTGRTAAAPG